MSIAPDHPAYDPTLDGHGPTITLTWREHGELIRLLDHLMEIEAEGGWSFASTTRMVDLLTRKARESSLRNHPSAY